jgi:hypothetical protein
MNGGNDDFDILKELIGEAEAQKIAKVFADGTLYIPRNIVTAELYRIIKQAYKTGATYRDLSLRYGLWVGL